MKTTIIPQLKEIKISGKEVSFSDFYCDESVKKNLPIAEEIFSVNLESKNKYPISFIEADLEDEEYKIIVKAQEIFVYAKNSKGLMYGIYTLSELSIINDDAISECEIHDKPSLKFRGLSHDISRGIISSTATILEDVKRLARYKYNVFMPYLEDIFKFEAIPDWGKYSDPICADEWKLIIGFAKQYNIEIRPIINLLGHFDKLSNIKSLQPLALKYPDGRVSKDMDPKNPEVRQIIKVMLKEVVDCFGEGIIHCGGDEPCSLTEVYGVDEGATLFTDHYTFISEEVKKLNCTLMMYCDFFAPCWGDYSVDIKRGLEIPSDTQFVYWDYANKDEHPYLDQLHQHKFNTYISPGSVTWNRLSNDIISSFGAIKGLLKSDNSRSKGMIMSCWADGGDTLLEYVWPGVVAGANFCWSPNSDYSYEEFYELYHKSFFGFNKEQSLLLEPIYHHDRLIEVKNESEYKVMFFDEPSVPVSYPLRDQVYKIIDAMNKAEKDLKQLVPQRNMAVFNAFELTIVKARFLANKLSKLPDKKLLTIEDGYSYYDVLKGLASELLQIKELHRKLWFCTNRKSDWDLCECRYDDLYDQLNIFARNVIQRKMYNIQ
jgi:hypothetical protein